MDIDKIFGWWAILITVFVSAYLIAVMIHYTIQIIVYINRLKTSGQLDEIKEVKLKVNLKKLCNKPTIKQILFNVDLLTFDKVLSIFKKIFTPEMAPVYITDKDKYYFICTDSSIGVVCKDNNQILCYLSYNHIVINNELWFVPLCDYTYYKNWLGSACSKYLRKFVAQQ